MGLEGGFRCATTTPSQSVGRCVSVKDYSELKLLRSSLTPTPLKWQGHTFRIGMLICNYLIFINLFYLTQKIIWNIFNWLFKKQKGFIKYLFLSINKPFLCVTSASMRCICDALLLFFQSRQGFHLLSSSSYKMHHRQQSMRKVCPCHLSGVGVKEERRSFSSE
jgi:hypothetical protein